MMVNYAGSYAGRGFQHARQESLALRFKEESSKWKKMYRYNMRVFNEKATDISVLGHVEMGSVKFLVKTLIRIMLLSSMILVSVSVWLKC